jgi:hypothetical protein
MKTIESVSVWENGVVQQGSILNSYAVNLTLNTSATFWYGIFVKNEDETQGLCLAHGNLLMTGDAYTEWQADSYAWDWIAEQLNLTITGEYIPPVPAELIVEEEIVEEESTPAE